MLTKSMYTADLIIVVYACLDTCCSHFLTIIAGVDLHFRHESKRPVCRTWGFNPGHRGARRGCIVYFRVRVKAQSEIKHGHTPLALP